MHVVVAGGGTAGHVEPALNLADALRELDPDIGLTALGTAAGLEATLVPRRGYDLELIPAVPLPRRPSTDLLTLPARMRTAIRAVRAVLDRTGADVLVGFGGYVAMPAYLAARRRVPIVVHEANARAGLANRLGARFTPYVAETVAGSLPHARVVGIPLRRAITGLDRAGERAGARAAFGLAPDLPTLLVSGGSQGARRLNESVAAAAGRLVQSGIQVLHVVGPRNEDQLPAGRRPGYVTVPYARADGARLRRRRPDAVPGRCDDLRGGRRRGAAGDLRTAADRQRRAASQRPACRRRRWRPLVADSDLTPERVVTEALRYLTAPDRLAAASAAARTPARPMPPRALVSLVRQAAGGTPLTPKEGRP